METATPTASRRRRWWIVGLGAFVLVAAAAVATRVALPSLVQRLVSARAQALNARIDVGAVELSLWWGGLVLRDVTVRPLRPPGKGPDAPLIACRRLVLGWRWAPLWRREVHLHRVEIDTPRIVLDRLADGDFNLAALLPRAAAPSRRAPSATAPEWQVAIDRLVVSDAGVRFRDLSVDGGGPIDASLAHMEVARIAFAPGRYGRSTRLRLDLAVDEGRVGVVARLGLHGENVSVDARIRAQRLQLGRMQVYGPDLGWSDLAGRLSADLRYVFVPDRVHTLTGGVRVNDMVVHVPQLESPAFSAARVTGALAPIDFRRERVTLDKVRLEGGMLAVDPRGTVPVPMVNGPRTRPAPATKAAPSSWSLLIKSFLAESSELVLPGTPATRVAVELRAHDALVTGTARVPVRATLQVGDAGATFDGQTRIDAFDLAGALTLRQVSLPAVIDTFGWLPPNLLQAGRAEGTLQLVAGGRSGDLELDGSLVVRDLWVATDNPHDFSLGAKRIAGTLRPLRIPGIGRANVSTPTSLRLRDLELEAPYGEVTRTTDGWLLPALSDTAGPPRADSAAPPFLLTIDEARLEGARAFLADRTVQPYFVGGLDPFAGSVQHFAWPAMTVEYFQLNGHPPERGRLAARGWLVPGGSQAEVEASDVALPPLNPYVVTFTSYSVPRGRLSGSGTAWFGPWGLDVNSHLILRDFDLAGGAGDALFRERSGVSLAVGLAALRDSNGDIALDVPVSVDAAGTRVGVSTVMAGAFERALLNLASTPGKLVKALLPSKADPQAPFPAPIPFSAGQSDVSAGAEQVQRLAAFLAARPGLAVTLLGDGTKQDARALGELAVREVLTAGRHPEPRAERVVEQRVLAALGRGQAGAAVELSPEDTEVFDRWVAAGAVPGDAVQALAAARLESVRGMLQDRFGLGARRVSVRAPSTAVDDGEPGVLLQFGPVGGPR